MRCNEQSRLKDIGIYSYQGESAINKALISSIKNKFVLTYNQMEY